MSKTRWDRAPRREQWESDYFPTGGGLDQVSSKLAIKPGRMVRCENFEEVYGEQGYRFIKGYERFDGRSPSPSDFIYFALAFSNGNNAATISPGDVINNSPGIAGGTVVHTIIESGSFAGGDAAGYFILYAITTGFATGNPINKGATQVATASDGDMFSGSDGFEHNQEALVEGRNYYRTLIQAVPGAGKILGACIFNSGNGENVYAVRNVADNLSATLWKSTSGGWTAVNTYMPPSTDYRFDVSNFTGDPSNMRMFVVNGKGSLFSLGRGDVYTKCGPIFDTQATSISSVSIGNGAKTFTAVETARGWVTGNEVIIWQRDAVTGREMHHAYMRGIVTAYNAGTGQLDVNVDTSNAPFGAGPFTDWEIGLADYSDKPYLVRAHKNHLFLGYPRGQLQTSDVGVPFTFGGTAALFGMGQELTGLASLKGKSLAVFCERRIDVIEGSSSLDWDKQPYSDTSGAIINTIADNDGNPIYLNASGLNTLAATQNFGDVASFVFSKNVTKILERGNLIAGARMAANNLQYRLYYEDGLCLRMTLMAGGGEVTSRTVSASLSRYDHNVSCVLQGTIGGAERMFFGTDDGFIMEEDVSSSFDGEEIFYGVRLPFNHFKSPGVEKDIHKLELEVECATLLTFYYRLLFDYDDGEFHYGGGEATLQPPGGVYDGNDFDTFVFNGIDQRFETPADGQCRNMGLLVWAESDFAEPATLKSVMTYFSYLGIKR